ncbi:unnamed protein product [Schistocephalus solidus]|uniref:Fe2OG dioxygenase domain-containing protein n=1 Tax=Schistocephalus solidus TaxID=70667 RepID=A0A3P7BVJ1_SCHSO|nr:unnamed protein product [Schistocephalus solidus]
MRKYRKLGAKVVFSAEIYCWPSPSLEASYPPVKEGESRFLNSGSFVGPAASLHRILIHAPVADTDDDQLYYTSIFLDAELRVCICTVYIFIFIRTLAFGFILPALMPSHTQRNIDIALDTRSELFQNLNGVLERFRLYRFKMPTILFPKDGVQIKYEDETGYLYNKKTFTRPVIAHGNGPIKVHHFPPLSLLLIDIYLTHCPISFSIYSSVFYGGASKVQFNSLTNYMPRMWTPNRGCQHCQEDNIKLEELSEDFYPVVQISTFITTPTPFIEDFYKTLADLNYPKHRIYLVLYCNVEEHYTTLLEFNATHAWEYKSSIILSEKTHPTELAAKKQAWSVCLSYEDCAFALTLDSIARLTSKNTLYHLVRMNRNALAPLLYRPGKLWSNFWGALNHEGYYARSSDYMDIILGKQRGIWNVPFVSSAYLYSRWTVRQLANLQISEEVFADMAIAEAARSKEWERKYVHPGYFEFVNASKEVFEQPCPDVFWFPFLSERFCRELIEELENFGQWSNGSPYDSRLESGYENVPTIDIHMRQIGWEEHWIHLMQTYIHPLQQSLYEGYTDLPTARMNFVVRYKPDEQPLLRPHHDASTYTLNIALNKPGLDYKGGGANFIRYNCSVVDSRVGWALIHPGRLTHLHEGLRTTFGTRYIFVSFVNPT